MLVESAAHSEVDYMQGVSENIMLGQIHKGRTGAFDLILNSEMCKLGMEVEESAPRMWQGIGPGTAMFPSEGSPPVMTPWTPNGAATPALTPWSPAGGKTFSWSSLFSSSI